MSGDRLDDLWALHLDGGELDERQAASLLAAMRDDPQVRRRLLDQRALHGELAELGRGEAERMAFARQLDERLAAERDAPAFVRRVAAQLTRTRRPWWRRAPRAASVAALAAALLLAVVVPLIRHAWSRADAVARIDAIDGRCDVVRAGQRLPARVGFALRTADALVTMAGAHAAVRYGDGTTLRLDERADLSLATHALDKVVELRRGRIEAEVAPQPSGHPMSLRTAEATTTVVGTRFTLIAAVGLTRLTVEEGLVRFAERGRDAIPVAAGRSVVADGRRPAIATPVTTMPLPAFAGAEGFGCDTVGGRGGRVIAVTTLADAGPGSFREACLATGPRIIVFRVGGTIALRSRLTLTAANAFVTIAGQSAPGGGIQITGWDLMLTGGVHDVVIRHVRFRPGETRPQDWDKHCLCIDGPTAAEACSRIVVDHCSLQWGPNQSLVVWGHVHDVTVQWCLVEGIDHGPDDRSGGAKGVDIGAEPGDAADLRGITVHHCCLANCTQFNPLVAGAGPVQLINDVVCNWATFGTAIGSHGAGSQVDLIGNCYRRGPDSDARRYAVGIEGSVAPRGCLYVRDNLGPYREDDRVDDWAIVGSGYEPGAAYWSVPAPVSLRRMTPLPDPPVPVRIAPASEVVALVLAGVGATAPARDELDARLVADCRQGTGSIRTARAQRDDWWPVLAAGDAPRDGDGDGMPDDWEIAHGLDPADPTDGAADRDGDGATNVEEYLDGLAPR